MVRIEDKKNCCGCEACVQICPKQCITFEEDQEGFRYPLVDNNVCIECRACEKVCPVINQAQNTQPLHCFASKCTNDEVRMASSSGGVFTLLAEEIIHQGGVVFGAKFNEQWEVVHDYTEKIEGLAAFRTSKYVQSRIGNCFCRTRVFLKEGRKVLFSGTSCQIAALKLFLHQEYENLLTVDIICHGVPSPKVWRMYLDAIVKNARKGENTVSLHPNLNISKGDATSHHQMISGISFRDKRLGWKKFSFALTLAEAKADGKQNSVLLSHIHREDPYMNVFLSNINLRPSCYQCPAKAGKSRSDITLADYWGINKQMPDFDDDKGVGLIVLNSQKGVDYYNMLLLEKREVSEKDAFAFNSSYYTSVRQHKKRKDFFRLLNKKNINIVSLMNEVTQPTYFDTLLFKLKIVLVSFFRK